MFVHNEKNSYLVVVHRPKKPQSCALPTEIFGLLLLKDQMFDSGSPPSELCASQPDIRYFKLNKLLFRVGASQRFLKSWNVTPTANPTGACTNCASAPEQQGFRKSASSTCAVVPAEKTDMWQRCGLGKNKIFSGCPLKRELAELCASQPGICYFKVNKLLLFACVSPD